MTFKPHAASTMLMCLVLATASAQTGVASSAKDSYQSSFDGFNIDEHLQPLQPAARAAFMEQIRIVESSGVPPDVLGFFKSVPIVVDPSQKRQPGEFASRDGRKAVFVQDRPMATNRPIVLHELLHAYHVTIMRTEGPKIAEAYRKAVQSGVYPDEYRAAHFWRTSANTSPSSAQSTFSGPSSSPLSTAPSHARNRPGFSRCWSEILDAMHASKVLEDTWECSEGLDGRI